MTDPHKEREENLGSVNKLMLIIKDGNLVEKGEILEQYLSS